MENKLWTADEYARACGELCNNVASGNDTMLPAVFSGRRVDEHFHGCGDENGEIFMADLGHILILRARESYPGMLLRPLYFSLA